MNYYVYALLDPRKQGDFKFNEFEFNFEPFYIGISHRKDRLTEHMNLTHSKDKNKHKLNKIKNLQSIGFEKKEICHIVKADLSKRSAIDLEIKLIDLIGRIDCKSGPLTNHTGGGEGMYNPSEKQRKKISKRVSGIRNPFFNKSHTEKTKQKIRNTIGNSRAKELNANFGKKWGEEQKKQSSIRQKENHKHLVGENSPSKRPEVRKKSSNAKLGLKNPNASLWRLVSPSGENFIIEGGYKKKHKTIWYRLSNF